VELPAQMEQTIHTLEKQVSKGCCMVRTTALVLHCEIGVVL
jgi:hypothetical protein